MRPRSGIFLLPARPVSTATRAEAAFYEMGRHLSVRQRECNPRPDFRRAPFAIPWLLLPYPHLHSNLSKALKWQRGWAPRGSVPSACPQVRQKLGPCTSAVKSLKSRDRSSEEKARDNGGAWRTQMPSRLRPQRRYRSCAYDPLSFGDNARDSLSAIWSIFTCPWTYHITPTKNAA